MASQCGKARFTVHFSAVENELEVAFVALDFLPQPHPLALYWMYVCVAHRAQHVGSRVLEVVEKLARRMNYAAVRLKPHPLDESWSKELLIGWYRKRGYNCLGKDCDGMEKQLIVRGEYPVAMRVSNTRLERTAEKRPAAHPQLG